jgi:glycosyltransferase involved in cell wall biosynthesis
MPLPNQKRVEIAVVLRAFDGGGAQRDIILLCNAIAAKGTAVAILTLQSEGPLRALLDPAVCVVKIAGGKIRYAIPGLRSAIRSLSPRVILSSESNLNLCNLAAVHSLPRRQRPKVVLREVSCPSIAQARDPHRQNRIAYRILRHVYRHADRIITLTDGARLDLIKNFSVPEQKIAVMLTNAVIPPAAIERIKNWDAESGREADLIVSVGRLSPEKDHRTLLQAARLLPSGRPWRLALIGDGPERQALEAFARINGLSDRVTFTGHVLDPFAWMMRARVAVCSSVYEGLCNAIIEALACGTAVVSTNCPFGPREILRDGSYGSLVPVGDAPALAKAIEVALTALLMARGFDYTSDCAADRLLEILKQV